MESDHPTDSTSDALEAVKALYFRVLDAWNDRDAARFAALFAPDGDVVGFDGSTHSGRMAVESELGQIFAAHQTPAYVGRIRKVRFLGENAAILFAVAGMAPRGQSAINPSLNAIQTLIATKHEEIWLVTLFQNTPAQFHGRPELAEALTDELNEALKQSGR